MDMKQTRNMVGSGEHERSKYDFYETPTEVTEALLHLEDFTLGVWEPACGMGAISKVLTSHGIYTLNTDITNHGYEFQNYTLDFLKCKHDAAAMHQPMHPNIITNPPFRSAMFFALAGIKYVKASGGKLALLNRLQWLEGIGRKEKLFDEYPPSRVWVFSRRIPRMHNPTWTGKKTSSLVAFAWYVWDFTKDYNRETRLGWVDWKQLAGGEDE